MTDFLLLDSPGHGPWFWDGVKGAIEDNLRNKYEVRHLNYHPGKVVDPENLRPISVANFENRIVAAGVKAELEIATKTFCYYLVLHFQELNSHFLLDAILLIILDI